MKTISELNNQWWYRLMKVIYISLILFACVVSIVLNFGAVGQYQTDHLVVCNYGNRSTFLAYKDENIYVPFGEDFSNSLAKLPKNINDQLRIACSISEEELTEKWSKMVETSDFKMLFTITETKVITTTYLSASIWSIVCILLIGFISEVIRRIFYYIVLGKIKPINE